MSSPDLAWQEWEVRTSYLRHQVLDLEDLVRRPRHYGIDLVDQADEARAYVRSLPPDDRLWAEGFIELSIGGTQMLGPRLWDYVHVLWHTLVQLGVDLVEDGAAEQSFPDQDILMDLRTVAGGAHVRFRVGDTTVTVEREHFLRRLAEHAALFYDWLDTATGDTSTVEREKIARIREAAGA